ncbi:DUF4263 domain-containing protein [Bifidobacterium sp. ESL0784]|uniref:Shedu immune nuclease family protein n=1 Tax=Bifidobacterium sp. ESL0784 TaxID=2983231 RepID=UPI0023F9F152|nr:Shedu immune nuclease family protein [Bifidobacterium sp. ESL0784]MDF7641316.1 DUF4263 domain-containing protein [Bifidobacterium sp. ESL0784]
MSGKFHSRVSWNDWEYACKRLPWRTYFLHSKPYWRKNSSDYGKDARYIKKVFCCDVASISDETEMTSMTVQSSYKRSQVELLIVGESGRCKQLNVVRFDKRHPNEKEVVLSLNEGDANAFFDLIRGLPAYSANGKFSGPVDSALLDKLLSDKDSISEIYNHDKSKIRQQIQNDKDADDVIAIAARKQAVNIFDNLLNNPDYFEEATKKWHKPESVWQHFFEKYQWILGSCLDSRLLVPFDKNKLEKSVQGNSINHAGKRADALYMSVGAGRSMVYVELKRHTAPLLQSNEYRPECWAPSKDLAGGITQLQNEVLASISDSHNNEVIRRDETGAPIENVYLFQPRSYLIIGSLQRDFYETSGKFNDLKFRAFELFRRNVVSPEIITYDELFERAKWMAGMNDES